jgi:hypothetical protein
MNEGAVPSKEETTKVRHHKSGKELVVTKRSVERYKQQGYHPVKEEVKLDEGSNYIAKRNQLFQSIEHKVGDSVTVDSKFFGKQKGKVTKIDKQSTHVQRNGKKYSEKYPHDAVVKEEYEQIDYVNEEVMSEDENDYRRKIEKNNKRFVAATKRQQNPLTNVHTAKEIEKKMQQKPVKESASEPTEGEMKGKQQGMSRRAQIVKSAAKGKKTDNLDTFQKDPELSSEIHKT